MTGVWSEQNRGLFVAKPRLVSPAYVSPAFGCEPSPSLFRFGPGYFWISLLYDRPPVSIQPRPTRRNGNGTGTRCGVSAAWSGRARALERARYEVENLAETI